MTLMCASQFDIAEQMGPGEGAVDSAGAVCFTNIMSPLDSDLRLKVHCTIHLLDVICTAFQGLIWVADLLVHSLAPL